MAQAVEPDTRRPNQGVSHQDTRCGVSRDSKISNSIVQLPEIPHSQTKLASQPEGFGLMGHVSHAREEINAAGNVDGKLRNAILWC